MTERMNGTIIRVVISKGFGFVKGVDDRLSRFMHANDVEPVSAFDTMHEGQCVTFESEGELDETPNAKHNGLRAVRVRPTAGTGERVVDYWCPMCKKFIQPEDLVREVDSVMYHGTDASHFVEVIQQRVVRPHE